MNWQSVVRDGAIVAALMALDGEVIPVSGDTPKLDPHWEGTDVAPGTFEAFQIQSELNGVSYLITLETNEAQTRLPINPVALTGTATSASTATGTLSLSGVTIDVDGDTAFVQNLAPPLYPDLATLLGIEATERLPISAVALSGTATSNSTATGSLGVAALPIDVSADAYPADQIEPDSEHFSALHHASEDNHAIPVDGFIAPVAEAAPLKDDSADVALSLAPPEWHGPYPEHDPAIAPVALSGTATSTSTATGTLSVSGVTIEPTDFVRLDGPEWHGPEPEHDPTIAPVSISGTATSTSTATGTLTVSGATIEPTDCVPLDGPDQDATTAILMAAEGEVIPVDGTVAPPLDPAPLEDDSDAIALTLAPPEYHGPYPEHDPAINPRAISGTATSTSTATGTLSVAGTTLDVSADTDVADKLAPASDPVTPHLEAEADQQVPIKPVSISGTAISTSTATGTLTVAGVHLDVSSDTAVAPFLSLDRDATTAIYQAALDGESIPVTGTVTGVPGTATLSDTAPVATLSDTSPTASISDSPAPTATLSDSAPTATLSDSAPTATLSDAIP